MSSIRFKWAPQMDKNQRVLINIDSLAPPWLSLSNVGANFGERVGFLSDVIRWHHSTNQNFFRIYWNFLIGWMMWHCAAYRVYINPAAHRVSWKKLFYAQNPIAATPSPLFHILSTLLSPLFTSKIWTFIWHRCKAWCAWNRRLQDFFDRLLLQLQEDFWRSS